MREHLYVPPLPARHHPMSVTQAAWVASAGLQLLGVSTFVSGLLFILSSPTWYPVMPPNGQPLSAQTRYRLKYTTCFSIKCFACTILHIVCANILDYCRIGRKLSCQKLNVFWALSVPCGLLCPFYTKGWSAVHRSPYGSLVYLIWKPGPHSLRQFCGAVWRLYWPGSSSRRSPPGWTGEPGQKLTFLMMTIIIIHHMMNI